MVTRFLQSIKCSFLNLKHQFNRHTFLFLARHNRIFHQKHLSFQHQNLYCSDLNCFWNHFDVTSHWSFAKRCIKFTLITQISMTETIFPSTTGIYVYLIKLGGLIFTAVYPICRQVRGHG